MDLCHSKNDELIHFLEEEIEVNNELLTECFMESIKCHHNDIAHYIQDNFLDDINDNILLKSYSYHNYEFLPQNFDLIKKDDADFNLSLQYIIVPSSVTKIEKYA